jgi:hypothetical protein
MACELTIWNTEDKSKRMVVCDEENAGKIVEDDHAAKGGGDYADTSGASFAVDWTKCRLVKFNRMR